jgi:hypothetical protein
MTIHIPVPAVCIGVYRAKYSQAFLRKSGVTVPCTPIHPHNNGTHTVPGIYSTVTVPVPLQNRLEMAHRGLKKVAFVPFETWFEWFQK